LNDKNTRLIMTMIMAMIMSLPFNQVGHLLVGPGRFALSV
jgi:hypothetical protein